MARIKTVFTCQECGHQTPKWLGKCPDCNQWNSFSEEEFVKTSKSFQNSMIGKDSRPKTINEIEHQSINRYKTKISEFDRVMGGGITLGSLTLIGGEPGIGKSTLLMEVCGKLLNESSGEQKIL